MQDAFLWVLDSLLFQFLILEGRMTRNKPNTTTMMKYYTEIRNFQNKTFACPLKEQFYQFKKLHLPNYAQS